MALHVPYHVIATDQNRTVHQVGVWMGLRDRFDIL